MHRRNRSSRKSALTFFHETQVCNFASGSYEDDSISASIGRCYGKRCVDATLTWHPILVRPVDEPLSFALTNEGLSAITGDDAMNGIHDLGGMHGFGPVVREKDEPVFHAEW
jgi:hypothetical protein